MTTINTDCNNTELLDQELTIEELEGVCGGSKWNEAPEQLVELGGMVILAIQGMMEKGGNWKGYWKKI